MRVAAGVRLVGVASLLTLSCGKDATAPLVETESLTIWVETRGLDLDVDGYLLQVGDAPAVRVATQDSVRLEGLPAGRAHELSISDLAGNCAVDGENPLVASAPAGSLEAQAIFRVLCTFEAEITFTRYQELDPDHSIVSLDLPSLSISIRAVEGTWAAWSRDGEWLAFTRDECSRGIYELCDARGISVVRDDGTGRSDLTEGTDTYPSWSPGGDEIVFERHEPGQPFALYRVRSDGSGVARVDLPPEVRDAYEPAWSPTGDRLAFSCSIDGPPEICVLDLSDGRLTRVTRDDPEWDEHPAWSPDGTRLAYRSWAGFAGPPMIAVVNADGTGLVRLHPGHSPSWSPDGTRLVYQGDFVSGVFGLRIVNIDGSDLIVLTEDAYDAEPVWRR